MRFHCKVCDKTFKKFVLFEGHFDFSDKCREKYGTILHCYVCSKEFQHSASLKYHLQQHKHTTTKYVNKHDKIQRVIPKITLKKQWNFKIVPQTEEGTSSSEQCNFKIVPHVNEDDSFEEATSEKLQSQRKSEMGKTQLIDSTPNDGHLKTTANVQLKKGSALPLKRNQCSICKIVLNPKASKQRLGKKLIFFASDFEWKNFIFF